MNHFGTEASKKTVVAALAFTVLTVFILTAGAILPLQAQSEPAGKRAPAVNHNTWTSGTAMPTATVAPCAAIVKGKLYVVGGFNGSPLSDTQIYNPSNNTWSTGLALPAATSNAACAVVKNILYVIGGTTNIGASQTNAVWAYNPKTKAWSGEARENSTASADQPRSRAPLSTMCRFISHRRGTAT